MDILGQLNLKQEFARLVQFAGGEMAGPIGPGGSAAGGRL
jgi:hypothetical protein